MRMNVGNKLQVVRVKDDAAFFSLSITDANTLLSGVVDDNKGHLAIVAVVSEKRDAETTAGLYNDGRKRDLIQRSRFESPIRCFSFFFCFALRGLKSRGKGKRGKERCQTSLG